ncbi:MAG: hypothetical protein ACI80V_001449 [Rhodothermales bacterium]|jgi:hypothetical protein
MNMNRLGWLCSVLLLGVTVTAAAQSHSIRIEDGKVYVDDKLQPADALPHSLVVDGITANLSFSGPTHFRLGDSSFLVDDGALVEADPTANDFVVFFGSGERPRHLMGETSGNTWQVGGSGKAFGMYYEMLDGHLKQMDQLHAEFDQNRSFGVAERLSQEAEQAAIMVRAFPRIEMQNYLEDIQDRNEGLYDGILREQLMEIETRKLASRIQTTSDSDRRRELSQQLLGRLEEIFELKQENRLAEVAQLDTRLRELKAQMDTRESRRKEIVERRLRELLGEIR